MPLSGTVQRRLAEADGLLRQRRPQLAEAICRDLIASDPGLVDARLIAARARQMLNDFAAMLEHVDAAIAIDPDHPVARLMRAEALILQGEIGAARRLLALLKLGAGGDPRMLARVAEMETQLGYHAEARDTLRKVEASAPNTPAIIYNLASAEIAMGNLKAAEALLDRLIAIAPHDYDAYYNRATLRRQTASDNHIEEMEALLSRLGNNPAGETQLCYALAKEYEDIGEIDLAFDRLARGAAARRRGMAYKVEDDIATMEAIARTFDADYLGKAAEGRGGEEAMFVLGLPRSGTTLVDRILSSHPQVESVGEINDLALAITSLCRGASSKEEMVRKSASIGGPDLASAYRRSTCERAPNARFIVDKTPLNFLYIGLIARAMPSARIIHLERDPMDVGFAMFKTLFRMGYPFSYDLEDIGRYIVAKQRLMTHWSELLPGRIVTVRYEDLVADQEGESRKLIGSVGLDWDDACLAFHKNAQPSATASAAQVRQPIYASSVGKWRAFARHLGPLQAILEP